MGDIGGGGSRGSNALARPRTSTRNDDNSHRPHHESGVRLRSLVFLNKPLLAARVLTCSMHPLQKFSSRVLACPNRSPSGMSRVYLPKRGSLGHACHAPHIYVETIHGVTKLGLCGEDSTEGTRGCGLGSRIDRWRTLLKPYNLSLPSTCCPSRPTFLMPRCKRWDVPMIDWANRGWRELVVLTIRKGVSIHDLRRSLPNDPCNPKFHL